MYKIINLQSLENVNVERPRAFVNDERECPRIIHALKLAVFGKPVLHARDLRTRVKAGVYKNLDNTKTDASYWHVT